MHSADVFVACVAIVSARVRLEGWDESKKRNEGRGGGEGRKSNFRAKTRLETLATQAEVFREVY